jgi:hypothetical protein
MLSTPEKTFILTGSLIGSVILFSTALDNINKITLSHYNNNTSDNVNNKLFAINGLTMLFSAATFSYFTFVAIK